MIPLEEPTEKEKAEEQALENRNPLRYVTKVKGKLKDGTYHDYKINAVYKLPMDDFDGDMPTWYESLGEDVNVYLLSLTQTIDKKDRRNYTLIKFQGSKDEVWFSMANAAFGKNDDFTGTIVAEYNSLISFDGYESIRNTVEYDTIYITANFAADDDISIDSFTVEIEGKKDYTSYNEMTYIGGGKITYESFV